MLYPPVLSTAPIAGPSSPARAADSTSDLNLTQLDIGSSTSSSAPTINGDNHAPPVDPEKAVAEFEVRSPPAAARGAGWSCQPILTLIVFSSFDTGSPPLPFSPLAILDRPDRC